MSTPTTPQTLTTMEACMTLHAGQEADFWRAQERMGPVVAAQPGFRAVIGGPIANSPWMYFSGKFENPEFMNQWYGAKVHRPVMDKAHSTWFDAFFIRKWRKPAEGEELVGPLFCETSIVPEAAFSEEKVNEIVATLSEALPRYDTMPFETLIGVFEKQPFQFIGPVEEFPQVAPVRYQLNTHWETAADLDKWLASPEMAAINALGEVTSDVHVLLRHEQDEREGLNADGTLRSWLREGATL
jgi:heme-degrading monooxygenase HmoA